MSYRRRVLLLNKPFQIRFCFYVCSSLIALGFGYPLIISNLFDFFLNYLAADPAGPSLTTLEKTRSELLWLLIMMQLILLGLMFLISLFMSHRIAGPLHQLVMNFREVKAGNFKKKMSFRSTDYFQDIVHEYNEMLESIKKRLSRYEEAVDEVGPRIEKIVKKGGVHSKELQSILEELRKR